MKMPSFAEDLKLHDLDTLAGDIVFFLGARRFVSSHAWHACTRAMHALCLIAPYMQPTGHVHTRVLHRFQTCPTSMRSSEAVPTLRWVFT